MIECALEFGVSRGRLYVDDSKLISKTEEKYMQARSSPSSQRKTRIDELASMQNGMLAAVNAMSKVCVRTCVMHASMHPYMRIACMPL